MSKARYKEMIVVEKAEQDISCPAESSMSKCKHRDNAVHNDKVPNWQSYNDQFLCLNRPLGK